MSIVIFILVLFLLVLVHELGHFIMAKKTGMRVDEFGIGFPPRLWGIKRGETLYSINAVPLGGFVKIYGEDGDVEDVTDRSRAFSSRPLYAQALTLVAGVACNLLFAWLIFSIAFILGTKSTVDEATASPEAKLTVLTVLKDSPAEEAGLRPGTEIIGLSTLDGHPVDRLVPSVASDFIGSYDAIVLNVRVRGEERTVELHPQRGLSAQNPDRKVVGVSMGLVETERESIGGALLSGLTYTYESTIAVVLGIWDLVSQAVTFRADLSQVAGPVGMAGLVGDAVSFGFTSLLMFTAFISLNLAVINILPFPALDGGRLLFVIIEAVRRKPIPARFAYTLNAVGFALLIALMVAVTYNDILRIVS